MEVPGVFLNACSDICPKHVNEMRKYYCSSHDLVGCNACMTIDHKSCQVDRIQDISTAYFNGTEHNDIVRKIKQFAEDIKTIKKDVQNTEKNTKEACAKAVEDVQTFKKEIIDYLNKAECEMLKLLDEREKRDISLIHKLEQNRKRIHHDIKEIQAKLQLQEDQANTLFVKAKQLKTKLFSIEVSIKQLKKDVNIDFYEFHRSACISQLIDSRLKFGELSIIPGITENVVGNEASNEECFTTIADQTIIEKKNISEMDAHFDCEINIKLKDDASDCSVRGSVLMSQSHLVIADYGNTCIKIVDVKNKNVSKYKLRSIPYDVAVVNPELIAVTLPDEKQIQFLAVTAGYQIAERDKINVGKSFRRIAIYEDRIICLTNESVEIISMNGDKIKSISHPNFSCLLDIAVITSSQIFYVCNVKHNITAVYKFDFDGNLIATYEDKELEDVRGLEITRDGTLLACNWIRDGSIHMISPDCKKIKELLKENEQVSYPLCVAFCKETNKLFIANFKISLDEKVKNVLKVFQLM